jgi:hypothetical protein
MTYRLKSYDIKMSIVFEKLVPHQMSYVKYIETLPIQFLKLKIIIYIKLSHILIIESPFHIQNFKLSHEYFDQLHV